HAARRDRQAQRHHQHHPGPEGHPEQDGRSRPASADHDAGAAWRPDRRGLGALGPGGARQQHHSPIEMNPETPAMSRYAKYQDLKIEVSNKVATVTLNRPEARNAINQRLIRELRSIWDDLADDMSVNAVLVTGSGSIFSVGGDVKAMSERPGGDVLEEGEVHAPMISRRLVNRPLELDKPIICA